MTNIHGFVPNSKSPLTTKLGKIVNKQCSNFTLKVMLASLILGCMTNNYVYVYNCIRLLPNTLGRIIGQHALALVSKGWWSHCHGIMWSRGIYLVLISHGDGFIKSCWLMSWYGGLQSCRVWLLKGFWN